MPDQRTITSHSAQRTGTLPLLTRCVCRLSVHGANRWQSSQFLTAWYLPFHMMTQTLQFFTCLLVRSRHEAGRGGPGRPGPHGGQDRGGHGVSPARGAGRLRGADEGRGGWRGETSRGETSRACMGSGAGGARGGGGTPALPCTSPTEPLHHHPSPPAAARSPSSPPRPASARRRSSWGPSTSSCPRTRRPWRWVLRATALLVACVCHVCCLCMV